MHECIKFNASTHSYVLFQEEIIRQKRFAVSANITYGEVKLEPR